MELGGWPIARISHFRSFARSENECSNFSLTLIRISKNIDTDDYYCSIVFTPERNISNKNTNNGTVSIKDLHDSKKIEEDRGTDRSNSLLSLSLSRALLYNLTQIYARLKFPGSAAVGTSAWKVFENQCRSCREMIAVAHKRSPNCLEAFL